MRALVLVTMLSLVACKDTRSPKVRVGFTVKVPVRGQDGPLEDRPLVGADRLVTWVERGAGETVDGSMRTVSLPATSLSLPALPFGDDLWAVPVSALWASGEDVARHHNEPVS